MNDHATVRLTTRSQNGRKNVQKPQTHAGSARIRITRINDTATSREIEIDGLGIQNPQITNN